jgi:hypothetical protein
VWDALEAVYQVAAAETQEELFALRATVLEQLRGHTVGSRSLVIGHVKRSLVDLVERERCTQCWIVGCWVLAEAVNPGGTACALYSF